MSVKDDSVSGSTSPHPLLIKERGKNKDASCFCQELAEKSLSFVPIKKPVNRKTSPLSKKMFFDCASITQEQCVGSV